MRNKIGLKLSTKIIGSIVFVTMLIFIYVGSSINEIIKTNTYIAETEKASILLDAISSDIGMNLYLGLLSEATEKVKKELEHSDILALKITLSDGRPLGKFYANGIDESMLVDSIMVGKDINDSVTGKSIANIQLYYPNNNYLKLVKNFQVAAAKLVAASAVALLLILIFIKYLLRPLGVIADRMRTYRPGVQVDFNIVEHDNEIGLIVSAFKNMQRNIDEYSEQLSYINQNLERKIEEKTAEIRHAYLHDSLTKLPNRIKLTDDLKILPSLVAILNIDDFKEVNDFFGFVAGDEVLVGVGRWLAEHCDRAYKLSGDEFAFVFDANANEKEVVEKVERILADLHATFFVYEDEYIQISATVGISFETKDAIIKADMALHYARQNKQRVGVYTKELNIEEKYHHNIMMTSLIKDALENNRVVAYYQPIVNTITGEITKYETLARLINKSGEVMSPISFLPIAQKSKLYPELTRRIVYLACKTFKDRKESVSLNISVTDLLNPATVDFIFHTLKDYKVGNRVIFELLESEGIEHILEVSDFISRAKQIGAKIAVDDFGTGYSNFEHILKLNVDYLKIDGSLIKEINTNQNARAIVETLVGFSKKLGISVVAEYVCEREIFDTVKELGIDSAQGYYIGEPSAELVK